MDEIDFYMRSGSTAQHTAMSMEEVMHGAEMYVFMSVWRFPRSSRLCGKTLENQLGLKQTTPTDADVKRKLFSSYEVKLGFL